MQPDGGSASGSNNDKEDAYVDEDTLLTDPANYFSGHSPFFDNAAVRIEGADDSDLPESSTKKRKRAPKKEETEADAAKRKISHAQVEKKRRNNINDQIERLKVLLPDARGLKDKGSVLQAAVSFIEQQLSGDRPAQSESLTPFSERPLPLPVPADSPNPESTREKVYWKDKANAFMMQRDAMADVLRSLGAQVVAGDSMAAMSITLAGKDILPKASLLFSWILQCRAEMKHQTKSEASRPSSEVAKDSLSRIKMRKMK